MNEVKATFFIARATAIDRYARCEGVIGMLFAHLLGVPLDYAGVAFFKINNAPSRLAIVERLIKKRHGTAYNKFWDSIAKQLRRLDEDRNHIVHWVVLHHASGEHHQGETIRTYNVTLTPPNIFDRIEGTKDITLDDLNDFSEKCTFFTSLLSEFHRLLTCPEKLPTPLRDIFQQQVVYPPPNTHPLVQR